ncbi:hypothetical protein [Pseudomonas sp. NPDC007930]|uniref:hypothetical protein n=1 Tax=Pseudomonas sp. NPDC007930 TaxID=3364417 RepID=UPI0036ED3285
MPTPPAHLHTFLGLRRELVGYAAKITGDRAQAEVIVQEAWLRFNPATALGGGGGGAGVGGACAVGGGVVYAGVPGAAHRPAAHAHNQQSSQIDPFNGAVKWLK